MTSVFAQVFPPAESGGARDLTGTADSSHYVMGLHFVPDVAGTVNGIWYWIASGTRPNNGDFGIGLGKVDPSTGVRGTTSVLRWEAADPSTPPAGAWHLYPFSSGVAVNAGDRLYAMVRTNHYGFAHHVFLTTPKVSADGHLTAPVNADGSGFPNGSFVSGTDDVPTPPVISSNWGQFNEAFYGIDPDFTPAGGGPVSTERWGIPL